MGIKFVIDPGHYKGYNLGVDKTYSEGTSMYNLGVYLKAELERYNGFTVQITRNKVEENPDLDARGKMAVKSGADVFLSLHSDAATPQACGVSVFGSVKLPGSKDLGEKLGMSVAQLMKQGNGITHFRGFRTRSYPNSSITDYYGVTRSSVSGGSKVKYSFLLEHGFHTSPAECKWLNNDANLRQLAALEAKIFADYFKVLLKDNTTVSPDPNPPTGNALEYVVLANSVDGYSNASDALSGTNKKTSLPKGTYYIFRVFSNGCINITTDPKGLKPGAWINPQTNIAQVVTPDIQTYDVVCDIPGYNTAADAVAGTNNTGTLTKGTYYIYRTYMNGAINITLDPTIQKPGLWMYPKDNVVVTPVVPPVVDLGDTSKLTPITMSPSNMPICTFNQFVKYIKANNDSPKIQGTVEDLVYMFMKAGFAENIRWDIALSQAIHETGFFKFGNQVKPEQNNFAGIGATNDGAQGSSFDNIYWGALAQMQHLKAYANTADCNEKIMDPRFKYVTRGWAPYLEWLGAEENPKNATAPTPIGWAVPGKQYGHMILEILTKVSNFQ